MKTHGIDIQKDGITITKLSGDGTFASSDDETLSTSKANKSYVDDKVESGCRAYRTVAQNIPDATFTKVQFNIEDYDNLNEYDHVTNHRFTATKAGVYLVCSAVQMVILEDASRIVLSVYKNGSEYARCLDYVIGASGYVAPIASVPVKMAANDYVEIFIYQNSAGAKNTYTNYVYMIVQRVA